MTAPGTAAGETVDALVQLSFVVHGILVDAGAAVDLSITQVRLLGVLRGREPGMAELASHLGLDRSSVSGLIDRAERRGLVRRRSAAHDGRVVLVGLTAEGTRLAESVEQRISRTLAELTARLSPAQQRQLTAHASTLVAAAATSAAGD